MKVESNLKKLLDFIDSPNVAEELDEDKLKEVGTLAKQEYDIDEASRRSWLRECKKALAMANQETKRVDYPWPGAANVKMPLITGASIQFSARALSEIVRDGRVVHYIVVGDDQNGEKKKRGDRISDYMSHQLLREMSYWVDDTDRMIAQLSIVGTCFRKVTWDSENNTVMSKFVSAEDVTVFHKVKDIENARRISHKYTLYWDEIQTKVRRGLWRDVDLNPDMEEGTNADSEEPYVFIEQFRRLDLDDDDYPEPYIVTFARDTGEVVNIQANYDAEDIEYDDKNIIRIKPKQFWVKYGLLPNPDGGFYDIGYGQLLGPMNRAINGIVNRLLNAGMLQTMGGGFLGRGFSGLQSGEYLVHPNRWHKVDMSGDDIRKHIIPMPAPNPSPVLFQLLGFLWESAKDLGSIKDIMTGKIDLGNVSPTAVLAQIEKGETVNTTIMKRIFAALTDELRIQYRLNSMYLEDKVYKQTMDQQFAIARQDFAMSDHDVYPSGDPQMSSWTAKMAQANALQGLYQAPGVKPLEITRRIVDALQIKDSGSLLYSEEEIAQQEQQQQQQMVQQQQIMMQNIMTEIEVKKAEVGLKQAKALQALADAETKGADDTDLKQLQAQLEQGRLQLEAYKMMEDTTTKRQKMLLDQRRLAVDERKAIEDVSIKKQKLGLEARRLTDERQRENNNSNQNTRTD